MKRAIFALAVFAAVWAVAQATAAQRPRPNRGPDPPQPPAEADRDGDRGHPNRDGDRHHDDHHHRPGGPRYLVPYPYSYPYGYWPYVPSYYYYAPYYGYSSGPYVLPPVYAPAESLFGPQSVQRFMGVEQNQGVAPNVNVIVPRAADVDPPEEPKPNLRGTNRQSLDLAWRFIGFGDAHFDNQKYSDANQRYRKAAQVAPQLGEAWFRQGFALIALGRYDAAAAAIKRGLALEPDWPTSNFHVDDLYGQDKIAKKAHLDALALAATNKAGDSDLHFLLGVFLYFDGQRARAKTFFDKAAQLAGPNDDHIRAFPK